MFRKKSFLLLMGTLACSFAAFAQTNNATKRTVPRPGGLGNKVPELPANLFTAAGAVSKSPLKHEWVDIPAGKIKLHTWIHYPQGDSKVPVVLLMHYDAGMDDLQRSMADQLASEGFLVVAPDLTSGMGPKGGNFESFKFPDEALRANLKVTQAEAMRRYRVAYDYAMKMPRSNGKIASVGCGLGGAYSFRFAAEAPKLDAAVVWYGAAPDAATIAKIKARVLGLYGGDDPVVTPTIDATKDAMAKAGKTYEPHIYDGATNAFMTYQAEGGNGQATAQSWILAMEFLKEHLQ
ncbi:MAG: dienelactone hydrolase family protein [Bryobacteraceae bacterium]